MRIPLIIALLLTANVSIAEIKRTYKHSGSVETTVNATNQEGFDCAKQSGKSYLLRELPAYFSTEFGKVGLLRGEHVGQYKLAIVINERSEIVGYKISPDTKEESLLVQTIINMKSLPALNSSNTCIADNPYIFEFTIK